MPIKEATVYPVDDEGKIVVRLTNSVSGVTGTLPKQFAPVNENGEMEMAVAGDLTVGINTTFAGEDFENDTSRVMDKATQEIHIIPTPTPSGGLMPTEVTLGTVGGVGDYLKCIQINVANNTNAAVYVSQESAANPPTINGTTGTAPSGTTTVSVTASTAFTATANQYVGRILKVVYIPTGGTSAISFKRRITAHGAFSNTTALSFTVTHALPAGAAITSWQLEPATSYELIPFNTPVGFYERRLGTESTIGAYRINADSGVDVHVVGKFINS